MASELQVERIQLSKEGHRGSGQLVAIALFAVVCLTWGTTWIGIKWAVETVPPILAAGLRFLVAFPLLVVATRLHGAPLGFPKQERRLFFEAVVLYYGLPYLLINVGEQYVSSGLAALLFSTMPAFILLLSAVVLRDTIRGTQVMGIVLGFFALFNILREQDQPFDYYSMLGVAAILAAALMHAHYYVATKKRGARISVMTLTTMPIGVAGAALTLSGLLFEAPNFADFSLRSIGALGYLAIVATVGGFLAYFHLLKKINPVVLSYVFLIFPVIAVAVSAVAEGRLISPAFLGYVALLILGFALTKLPTARTARAALSASKLAPEGPNE